MTTKTKDEALDLHKRTRAWLIATARRIAFQIAERESTVDSRRLRAALVVAGLAPPGENERWLGAVFSFGPKAKGPFEPAGERPYEDAERNIHAGRPLRIWRLRVGAVTPPDPGPCPERPKDLGLAVAIKQADDEAVWCLTARYGPEALLPKQPPQPPVYRPMMIPKAKP